jgi:hypothetical protein
LEVCLFFWQHVPSYILHKIHHTSKEDGAFLVAASFFIILALQEYQEINGTLMLLI